MAVIADEEESVVNIRAGPFLQASLRPLWRLTQFMGFLFDWCWTTGSGRFRFLFTLYRLIMTCFGVSAVFLMFAFMLYRTTEIFFRLEIPWGSKYFNEIQKMVVIFSWLAILAQNFWNVMVFLVRRKDLLEFFQSFHQLEKELVAYLPTIKKTCVLIYLVFTIAGLIAGSGFFWVIWWDFWTYYLIGYYPALCNLFTTNFVTFFELAAFFLVVFIQLMSDVVPSLVFVHSANAIGGIRKSLEETLPSLVQDSPEKEAIFTVTNPQQLDPQGRQLHLIWTKYETLRHAVKRANRLFGSMLVINYGVMFFIISMSLFFIIRNGPYIWYISELLIPLSISSSCGIRMVFGIYAQSKLQKASHSLMTQMSVWQNAHWYDLNFEQKKVLSGFYAQQRKDRLAVCPLNLFAVSTKLFLTMLGLIITYFIILLQSA